MKNITHKNKFNNSEELDSFNELLIEIIDNVFKQKKDAHNHYFYLIQNLWNSKRSNAKKVKIAKYLITRLLRESHIILENSSRLAKRLCPCCNKQRESKVSLKKVLH